MCECHLLASPRMARAVEYSPAPARDVSDPKRPIALQSSPVQLWSNVWVPEESMTPPLEHTEPPAKNTAISRLTNSSQRINAATIANPVQISRPPLCMPEYYAPARTLIKLIPQ